MCGIPCHFLGKRSVRNDGLRLLLACSAEELRTRSLAGIEELMLWTNQF